MKRIDGKWERKFKKLGLFFPIKRLENHLEPVEFYAVQTSGRGMKILHRIRVVRFRYKGNQMQFLLDDYPYPIHDRKINQFFVFKRLRVAREYKKILDKESNKLKPVKHPSELLDQLVEFNWDGFVYLQKLYEWKENEKFD